MKWWASSCTSFGQPSYIIEMADQIKIRHSCVEKVMKQPRYCIPAIDRSCTTQQASNRSSHKYITAFIRSASFLIFYRAKMTTSFPATSYLRSFYLDFDTVPPLQSERSWRPLCNTSRNLYCRWMLVTSTSITSSVVTSVMIVVFFYYQSKYYQHPHHHKPINHHHHQTSSWHPPHPSSENQKSS